MNKCNPIKETESTKTNLNYIPLSNDDFSKSCSMIKKYNILLIVLVALTLLAVLVKK